MCAVEGGNLETTQEMMKYQHLKFDDVDNVRESMYPSLC